MSPRIAARLYAIPSARDKHLAPFHAHLPRRGIRRGGPCPRRRAALWECGSLLPLSPRRSLPAALNFGGLASARRASSLLCALRLFSVSSVVRFFTPLAFLSVLCACPPSCWAGLCGEICSRFPRQNLVSPRNLRRLPQHRRHRTIFRLAQLDR